MIQIDWQQECWYDTETGSGGIIETWQESSLLKRWQEIAWYKMQGALSGLTKKECRFIKLIQKLRFKNGKK